MPCRAAPSRFGEPNFPFLTGSDPFADGDSQVAFHESNCARCRKHAKEYATIADIGCGLERSYRHRLDADDPGVPVDFVVEFPLEIHTHLCDIAVRIAIKDFRIDVHGFRFRVCKNTKQYSNMEIFTKNNIQILFKFV